jgi:hypothetical protein
MKRLLILAALLAVLLTAAFTLGNAAPASAVNCGKTGGPTSPACGGGGGGQICQQSGYMAPNTWYDLCGGNNWRQIHVDFGYSPSYGYGCVASAVLDATGIQAYRCNSGHADAYDPAGHYGAVSVYNTSGYGVFFYVFATT